MCSVSEDVAAGVAPSFYKSFCQAVGTWNLLILSSQKCLSSFYSESERHSVVSDCLWPHGIFSPWNSPDQNTGVGRFFLFQGIFPTQGSNPGLPHCRRILYQLSHKGSPRILEWVKLSEVAQLCPTLCDPMDCSLPGSAVHSGNSTGVDWHFLLQGIFPTQGLNLGLPDYRQTLNWATSLLFNEDSI